MAEHQSLVPLLGLCHLSHDSTDDEGINDAANYALKYNHEHCDGALVCNIAITIANSGLCLDREEKGSREGADIGDTLGPVILQVSVEYCNQPEDTSEKQPRQQEGQAEDNEHPSPANVHARGEDVGQVALALLADVDELHIAVSVFLDKPALGLVTGMDFTLPVTVPIWHRSSGQLHTVLLWWHDAVAVGPHTSHHLSLGGLCCFCFGKQS